ncbi:MAG: hypothetical protein JXR63_09530 [Spirochaetales bacterium]|nr:hypothetical protein [Spirochaetales bacterium]
MKKIILAAIVPFVFSCLNLEEMQGNMMNMAEKQQKDFSSSMEQKQENAKEESGDAARYMLPEDSQTLYKVVTVNADAKSIFEKTKFFLESSIKPQEITVEDDQYKMSGKGCILLNISLNVFSTFATAQEVFFDFTFEARENRFKFTMKNIYVMTENISKDSDGHIISREPAKVFFAEETLAPLWKVSAGMHKKQFFENIVKQIESSGNNSDW